MMQHNRAAADKNITQAARNERLLFFGRSGVSPIGFFSAVGVRGQTTQQPRTLRGTPTAKLG